MSASGRNQTECARELGMMTENKQSRIRTIIILCNELNSNLCTQMKNKEIKELPLLSEGKTT